VRPTRDLDEHVAVSPLCVNTRAPPGNSASGSGVKRCGACSRADRLTKETIRNGLNLVRVRYGLAAGELPELSPSELGRYHLFLLGQGKERASVPFPRRLRRGKDGLCSLQRLRRHERWELALSVASIKRNLPAGCVRCTPSARAQWEEHVFSSPPPLPDEYLAHVKRVATRIFPPGWDSRYYSFVREHVPNPTAREPKRSRADHLWMGRREEFVTATTSETEVATVLKARYKEVMSAGKLRPLVIFDEQVELLGPLHKCLYSHLRGQDWLLCGPPTDKRVASVCTGRVQTSVDLVAASDGLHHSVAEVLLDSAFFTSVKVPRSLRALAKASLRPLVECEGGWRAVTHGQMMGAYLCFPLLCLQSYCAATWAARFDKDARFLVNGDDTVISASRGVSAEEYPPGFRLNDTKTARAEGLVEVNSTVFIRMGGKWREVRHLRRGGAPSDYQGMMHMAKAVSSRPCWVDAFVRSRIGRRWGFLPSQLGFRTYPAYLRERGFVSRREFSSLPERPGAKDDRLRCILGRDASPVEAESLRDFLWENGRGGGLKRDEWQPTPGAVRRTYVYRQGAPWRLLSFVSWASRRVAPLKGRLFFLPAGEDSDEEKVGLFALDLWRQAIPLGEVELCSTWFASL
jgi:hypothetical protein